MMRIVVACLIAAAVLSCTHPSEKKETPKQQPLSSSVTGTPDAGAPVEFGFSDKTGKRLLAIESPDKPQTLTQAACSGTEMLPVRFTGKKDPGPASSGRDTAANFDSDGGAYYEILNGSATEDDTCLMTDERFLTGRKAVEVLYYGDKPDKKTVERISQAKKRGVKETWGLARIDPDKIFYLVLFERAGDEALFSIVMATPGRLVFLDFPGDYKNEDSVWRVDDGGEVDAFGFSIGPAYDSAQGVAFMYTWMGAEGESIAFVRETGGVFRKVKTGYRYMSPA